MATSGRCTWDWPAAMPPTAMQSRRWNTRAKRWPRRPMHSTAKAWKRWSPRSRRAGQSLSRAAPCASSGIAIQWTLTELAMNGIFRRVVGRGVKRPVSLLFRRVVGRGVKRPVSLLLLGLFSLAASAREFHVSINGNDSNDGSSTKPYRSISAAAAVAQPGDAITVHEGTYRERVTPPRGGESDSRRIVYQAAPGEKAVIKGSEAIRGWKPFLPGVWKATLPNSFFGAYNPYRDLIVGDWFTDKGRPHQIGEVYLNGKSLWEANLLERVLNPQPESGSRDADGSTYTWFCESDDQNTYIYANFHDKNPNDDLVEINVRDSCFYPDQPGRNYITVRGFYLSQAATQGAAPTAEQIGLIGTHWSRSEER